MALKFITVAPMMVFLSDKVIEPIQTMIIIQFGFNDMSKTLSHFSCFILPTARDLIDSCFLDQCSLSPGTLSHGQTMVLTSIL
jgi:hypothetical protein